MLNILIIDDDIQFIEAVFNELNIKLYDKCRITKICTNGAKALNYILENTFDVIIVNVNLINLDIFNLINEINKKDNTTKLIAIYESIKYKIDDINKIVYKHFYKPFDLSNLSNCLLNLTNNYTLNKVENLLDTFNFNKSNIGYHYILDCLNYCVEKNYKNIQNMKELYKKIANINNITNSDSIGWNIEKSINIMNKNTDRNIILKHFNFYPSPKLFLNTILLEYYDIKRSH